MQQASLVTSDLLFYVVQKLEDRRDPIRSMAKLLHQVKEKFPAMKSLKKYYLRVLVKKVLRYSYVKVCQRPLPAASSVTINNQVVKAKEILLHHFAGARMVFIDEYVMNESQASSYAWSKMGRRSFVYTLPRRPSIAIIAAIDRKGLLLLKAKVETIDGDCFAGFIEELAAVLDESDQNWRGNTILFFDNARVHRSRTVHDKMIQLGIRCSTNIPYTPELNAAEYFIHAHKIAIRERIG